MFRCLNKDCGARFPVYVNCCGNCLTVHSIALEASLPRAEVDDEIELHTGRELQQLVYKNVEALAYPQLSLKRGAMVVALGRAGAGKSTLVARAIDSVRGTALLLSLEEASPGPSIAERLGRIGATREDLLVSSRASVDQIVSVIRSRRVVSLAIDSVQRSMFSPREIRHLLAVCPSLSVIFCTSQINASNEMRGGHDLAHECDVTLEVSGMRARVTKSRYQESGLEFPVLNERGAADAA